MKENKKLKFAFLIIAMISISLLLAMIPTTYNFIETCRGVMTSYMHEDKKLIEDDFYKSKAFDEAFRKYLPDDTTQKTLDNIMKAVEQGVVNNTTNKRMIELENKLEDIERQIIVEKSKTNFKLTKEDIVTYLNDALKLEPQLLINYIVNQIILFDDKMQIYFNSPTIKTTNESKTPFSTKIYKLPHIIQNKPQPEMIDMVVEFYI